MVQTVRIEAASRERAGKGAARATRRGGLVPAVIYGAKQEATLIALDPRAVVKELQRGDAWRSSLYEVAVEGGATERALMREVQFHPVTDRPLHVDFQRLAPGQKIRVSVPVSFVGEGTSPGLKAGGALNVVRRALEVLADPDAVPDVFELDVSEANIGDTLRWSQIRDHKGAENALGRDFVVATIAAPVAEEAAPDGGTAEAAAGSAPAAGKGGKSNPAGAQATAKGAQGKGGAPAAKAPAAAGAAKAATAKKK